MSYVEIRSAEKPGTIAFYRAKLDSLVSFEPLASARLDKVDEALIERYVQHRHSQVAPATVNRNLATLRRLLRLAHKWKVIDGVPRIELLPGERMRDFVLTQQSEELYLTATPQPLKDVAIVLLNTGMRLGEVLALERRDAHLDPVNGAKYGYLRVRDGKSRNAKRTLSITARVREVIKRRLEQTRGRWVFSRPDGTKPISVFTLKDQHSRVRKEYKLDRDFVIHSLRHTMLTRLGEAGVDVFTIMKIAGHSSVTVSQRYVHPSPEAVERAFERLETLSRNQERGPERQLVTTDSTTQDHTVPS